ncbi:MAG: AsmA family protein [Candidatus Omnitrophica bacterium]|nr:AsmA family protein [Candidatus Omnitrophota bacterium]
MKFLKGLVITVIVLFVLVFAGAYIFLKSFDINKYRAQIATEVGKQVGRTVAIEKLGLNLSLFSGVYAEAQGFKISEDPVFGQGDFLSVGSVQLNVDVMAYLSRREIVVSKVVVSGLDVKVVRDAQGVMNVQKIGPAPVAVAEGQPAAPAASAAAPAIPPFSVQRISIENGTVMFTDNAMAPPMQIAVSHIDFNVKDFSLQKPFGFEGQAAVLGGTSNVSLKGQAAIDMATQQVQLSGIEVVFDLAKLAVADLVKAVPSVEAAGLTDIQGKISIQVPSLTAGAQGLGALAMNGKFQDGKVMTKMLPLPVEKINADFIADEKDFTVSQYSLQLSTGVISGTAKITDYMKTMGLSAQVKVDALPAGALVSNLPEGMKLVGTANAELSISGQNLAAPDLFLSSLNGSGMFEVKDGKIENFNVLKTVLGRIEIIPGLAAAVEASIPEKYREEFTLNETIFQKAGSSIQITNGVVNMPDMQILSNLFEAGLQIKADAKLNGKVSGKVMIPADLSASLASQADALNYLKDSDGRITISLTSFEGPLASMKVMPDVKELGKVAIKGEGKRQLGNFINKALGVENAPAPQEGEPAVANPGEEIIGGVLDKIFK